MSSRRSAPPCWWCTVSATGPSIRDARREIARRLVGSEAVELDMLPRSGHAISVDVDRDTVNAEILHWFERFATAARPAAAAAE